VRLQAAAAPVKLARNAQASSLFLANLVRPTAAAIGPDQRAIETATDFIDKRRVGLAADGSPAAGRRFGIPGKKPREQQCHCRSQNNRELRHISSGVEPVHFLNRASDA
jgi:hypothetical protein